MSVSSCLHTHITMFVPLKKKMRDVMTYQRIMSRFIRKHRWGVADWSHNTLSVFVPFVFFSQGAEQ